MVAQSPVDFVVSEGSMIRAGLDKLYPSVGMSVAESDEEPEPEPGSIRAPASTRPVPVEHVAGLRQPQLAHAPVATTFRCHPGTKGGEPMPWLPSP